MAERRAHQVIQVHLLLQPLQQIDDPLRTAPDGDIGEVALDRIDFAAVAIDRARRIGGALGFILVHFDDPSGAPPGHLGGFLIGRRDGEQPGHGDLAAFGAMAVRGQDLQIIVAVGGDLGERRVRPEHRRVAGLAGPF